MTTQIQDLHNINKIFKLVEKMEDIESEISMKCRNLIKLDLKLRQILEEDEYNEYVPVRLQKLMDACDELFGTTLKLLLSE